VRRRRLPGEFKAGPQLWLADWQRARRPARPARRGGRGQDGDTEAALGQLRHHRQRARLQDDVRREARFGAGGVQRGAHAGARWQADQRLLAQLRERDGPPRSERVVRAHGGDQLVLENDHGL